MSNTISPLATPALSQNSSGQNLFQIIDCSYYVQTLLDASPVGAIIRFAPGVYLLDSNIIYELSLEFASFATPDTSGGITGYWTYLTSSNDTQNYFVISFNVPTDVTIITNNTSFDSYINDIASATSNVSPPAPDHPNQINIAPVASGNSYAIEDNIQHTTQSVSHICNFITTQYEDILNRLPTKIELYSSFYLLISGQATDSSIVDALASSSESTNNITSLIESTISVIPSQSQISSIISQIESGSTLSEIQSILIKDALLVGSTYYSLLNINIPMSFEDNWTIQLCTGELNLTSLQQIIADRPESVTQISALYLTLYQRLPTAVELESAQSQLATGCNIDNIVTGPLLFIQTPVTSLVSASDFVQSCYQNILGRTGSLYEVYIWSAQVYAGHISQSQLIAAFATSLEVSEDIGSYFQILYGTPPATAALDVFEGELSAGASLAQLYSSMLFQFDTTQITSDYESVLGRSPSAIEELPWVNQLFAGNLTDSQIEQIFAGSQEAQSDLVQTFLSTTGAAPTLQILNALEAELQKTLSLANVETQIHAGNMADFSQYVKPVISAISVMHILSTNVSELMASGTSAPGATCCVYYQSISGSVSFVGIALSNAQGDWALTQSVNFDVSAGVFRVTGNDLTSLIAEISSPLLVVSDATSGKVPPNITDVTLSDFLQYHGPNGMTGFLQQELNALAPGGELCLGPGVYTTEAPLVMKSNTTLVGNNATLQAGPNWIDWGSNAANNMMITNADASLSGISDQNISICNMTFNMNPYQYGGTSSIKFIGVEGVDIESNNFIYGNDGVALLNCQNAVINQCTAVDTNNAAYDNWAGSSNVTVENCTASIIGGYGILFNSVGENGADYSASTFLAINNQLTVDTTNAVWAGAGIWVSPLSDTSSIQNVTIEQNTVTGFSYGIVVGGNVSNASILSNSMNDISGPPLFVRQEGVYAPSNLLAENNTFGNDAAGLQSIQSNANAAYVQNTTQSANYYQTSIGSTTEPVQLIDQNLLNSQNVNFLGIGSADGTGTNDVPPSLGIISTNSNGNWSLSGFENNFDNTDIQYTSILNSIDIQDLSFQNAVYQTTKFATGSETTIQSSSGNFLFMISSNNPSQAVFLQSDGGSGTKLTFQ